MHSSAIAIMALETHCQCRPAQTITACVGKAGSRAACSLPRTSEDTAKEPEGTWEATCEHWDKYNLGDGEGHAPRIHGDASTQQEQRQDRRHEHSGRRGQRREHDA